MSAPATLQIAAPADAATLANLLELYVHDLSQPFALEVGEDGRFGYARLPLYWSEPEQRFPFLIRSGGKLAGFALVTRGVPPAEPGAFDIAEFFVLQKYRRTGVGAAAARLLWNRFPGRWTVRVSTGNRSGYDFWKYAVARYADSLAESERAGQPHPWRVFAFQT